MNKNIIRFIGAVAFVATALMSCEKQPGDEKKPGEEQQQDGRLVVTVENIGESTAELYVKNDDLERTIYFGIFEKAQFAKYASGDDFIRSTINYIDQNAAFNRMELSELLEQELLAGDIDGYEYEGLSPETEYVAYAFGLSIEGVATTGLYTAEFKTLEVGAQECTFTITASEVTGNSFTIEYKPSNPNTRYTCGIITKSTFDEYGDGTIDGIKSIIEMEFTELMSNEDEPMTLEEIIEEYTDFGTTQYLFEALSVNVTYYAYAVGIAVDGTFTTAVAAIQVTTESKSQNEFRLEKVAVTASTATYNIVATLALDTYAYGVVPSSAISGMTEKQVIEYMMSNNLIATYSGVCQTEFTGLTPETDYTVCVFGYSTGVATTNLVTATFKTEARQEFTGNVFSISVTAITQTSAKVTISVAEEAEGIYYYFDILPEATYIAEGGNDAALAADMEKGLQYYMSYYNVDHATALWQMISGNYGTSSATNTQLKMDTEYRVYVVGMYADGTICTPYTSVTFRTLSNHELIKLDVTYVDYSSTGGDVAYLVHYYAPQNTQYWYQIAVPDTTYEDMTDEQLLSALLKTFKNQDLHFYRSIKTSELKADGLIYSYCVAYADGERGPIQRNIYSTKASKWIK